MRTSSLSAVVEVENFVKKKTGGPAASTSWTHKASGTKLRNRIVKWDAISNQVQVEHFGWEQRQYYTFYSGLRRSIILVLQTARIPRTRELSHVAGIG
jgi:hypothetical protein